MTASIDFGSKQIKFQVKFAKRKSLGITVTPDMEVLATAPIDTPLERIKDKIRHRAPWIIKQQGFFLSFHPKSAPKRYVSGESHLYLGRNYRLRILSGKSNRVTYKGRFIEVTSKDKSKVKSLLRKWYREKAKEKFAEIAEPLIQKFRKYQVEPRGLYLQEMTTRWGSCTSRGKIILNPELVKAPKACIEYVIIHELCHLVHPNHTQKFFDLQTKEMKDWEKWKNKLEKLLA
ncbi:MAG: M48 family metallopeptidase [Cyclobacteriaceae bacterium]|nr:M48 family metallopeptidase [Cyclobacteriaceae bacterium]